MTHPSFSAGWKGVGDRMRWARTCEAPQNTERERENPVRMNGSDLGRFTRKRFGPVSMGMSESLPQTGSAHWLFSSGWTSGSVQNIYYPSKHPRPGGSDQQQEPGENLPTVPSRKSSKHIVDRKPNRHETPNCWTTDQNLLTAGLNILNVLPVDLVSRYLKEAADSPGLCRKIFHMQEPQLSPRCPNCRSASRQWVPAAVNQDSSRSCYWLASFRMVCFRYTVCHEGRMSSVLYFNTTWRRKS